MYSAVDTISLGKLVITWHESVAVHKTLYRHTDRCGEGGGHSTTITTGTQLLLYNYREHHPKPRSQAFPSSSFDHFHFLHSGAEQKLDDGKA